MTSFRCKNTVSGEVIMHLPMQEQYYIVPVKRICCHSMLGDREYIVVICRLIKDKHKMHVDRNVA